jgi:hypothetical protein
MIFSSFCIDTFGNMSTSTVKGIVEAIKNENGLLVSFGH